MLGEVKMANSPLNTSAGELTENATAIMTPPKTDTIKLIRLRFKIGLAVFCNINTFQMVKVSLSQV
jgi:hypothetical protein